MVEFPDERQLVIEARAQLVDWTNSARTQAYAELFEGDDPLLAPEDQQLLDAIDSALERQGGDGVWGTDQYGIHTAGTSSSSASLGVVCVYHPQITKDSVLRGPDGIDDDAEERLNAALWTYSERVSTLIEEQLDEYVREKQR
ncbi:hypothetical protein [Haloarchaeobius sp. HME9146]|uniref:DUF7539 family protein n=1 Tax=Haloarchaeobius sp. HME9146 TaxID=2978732 RepID=UPI0021BF3FF7|nr:hypothetical protein [Haloarchaeobius sp. HME9146]MCT9095599.1 hypothetical protein [Haloarchaeobius sp. HME9146]